VISGREVYLSFYGKGVTDGVKEGRVSGGAVVLDGVKEGGTAVLEGVKVILGVQDGVKVGV
jgi:hypothetical protein